MIGLSIPTQIFVVIIFVATMLALCALFIRLIKQNNIIMQSADHRLDRANEMVLTLAQSSNELSKSIGQLKEMMIHIEEKYVTRLELVSKDRDELFDSYEKLVKQYENLQHSYEQTMRDSFNTLKELARRPTINNTTGE